jgi:hypothetical protein
MAIFTPGEYKPSINNASNSAYFISSDSKKPYVSSIFGNTNTPIGYWILPGSDPIWKVKFSAYKKPRWLTRMFMQYVLEWKWEDHA